MILNNTKRVNTVTYKKLHNGKIMKSVQEQYLRKDLPCGLSGCPLCDVNQGKIEAI
jgi:hypothetical protein